MPWKHLLFAGLALAASVAAAQSAPSAANPAPEQASLTSIFGYRDFSHEAALDRSFLAVPDAKLAGEHLRTLTSAPHIAGSKEDFATAQYVAAKFRAAGLETSIVPYRVWLNLPRQITLEATDAEGKVLMTGPTPEHVDGDPWQDDPRVVPAFNSSSPSGDVIADVVYANYGRPEDFRRLDDLHIDLRGKIVLVRYGSNFRGVKVYIAQQKGAAGVIIYSDPADDGFVRGAVYPNGPYRPETGVQRGSVQFIFKYPGDATTPGVASTPDLPVGRRIAAALATSQPSIPSTPISWHDAQPILQHLGGIEAPHEWQGGLPLAYHLGGVGSVKVHMLLKQDYALRTIWDVIGRIPGRERPDEWVVAGNHRDAWVYGAVDPSSGTAAMLETVHGLGALLATGWRPRRTILFASWDAEEEGLIGSTEWTEQHEAELRHAVAYFNTDVGVAGPQFTASAVPSLKQFVREVAQQVPSPKGGTVYQQWKADETKAHQKAANGFNQSHANAHLNDDVEVGDLGSGSDFTPFLQHAGVPATDIGSSGPYGVYHSVFDNYSWFTKNADPTFAYEQQQARIFGLEVLHMADADVLPYDYVTYAKEIASYLDQTRHKASNLDLTHVDFTAAQAAADRLTAAANAVHMRQISFQGDLNALNTSLRAAEGDLLDSAGLPNRPWYKHTIYAPGEYTGYSAVVIPGVNEALDAKDAALATKELASLTAALNRAAATLESAK